MHPVIRICSLLLGVVMVVAGGWPEWLLALLCVVVLALSAGSIQYQLVLRMIFRLRWLMLSIILIYLLFTPGSPLFSNESVGSPSWQGLVLGAHRAAILLLMVVAVSVLLQSTSKSQLIAALLWLFAPFEKLGLSLVNAGFWGLGHHPGSVGWITDRLRDSRPAW